MYARVVIILLFILLTGCAEDKVRPVSTPVVVDIAFTVSKASQSSTRMTAGIVQDKIEDYRGIEMRHIVPFAIGSAEKVTASDMPKAFQIYGNGEKPVESREYYYYENCTLMSGVNAFLYYGRATQASTDKHINGSLVETFHADMSPQNIRFSLEPISSNTIHPTATALTGYMTAIANAKGKDGEDNDVAWKDAPHPTLHTMYLNFIGDGEPLPGSSDNIKAYTQALKTTLGSMELTDDTDIAIRSAIISAIDSYNTTWNNFPASIGLPDGAAVIRWTGTAFEPQINTTTMADINGIDRYAYPAELYYYGNSRIRTSTDDKRKEEYTDTDWTSILAKYENADGVVSPNTTAVAIKDPLQYGVAHVKIILKKTDTASLTDAKGADILVGTTNFPLTGILIGGQLPVGYDFTPTTTYPIYSEVDMKFIYDSQVKYNNEYLYLSSTADAAQPISTLTLQSYDKKKVPVALEFINNSDVDFNGLNGIIQKGTKFYLVGEIDPADHKTDPRTEIRDRVLTQDYTTTLKMKVTGLEKAYNVVPNLLSPRLEIGIELVPKWVGTTPEEILF